MMTERPCVFVGSSSESLDIVDAIHVQLSGVCEVIPWNTVCAASQYPLESLTATVDYCDFAVMVLAAEDQLICRDTESLVPRDNVIFELGGYTYALGRDRTFVVVDGSRNIKLPSDIAGLTYLSYLPPAKGNLQAALGSACALIRQRIKALGPRQKAMPASAPSI